MTVGVRLGRTEDVPQALDVFAESEAARRGSPVPADELGRLEERLRGGGWLLVAEDEESLVGVAAGFDAITEDGAGDEVIPGLAHLSLVFVRPAHWARGIGGHIVDAALREARRRRYDRIQLWTHEDNTRAQRLYAGRGFTRSGRSKDDERGARIGLWVRELRR